MSGQELWQFFGRFGIGALPGIVLATTIIALLGYAAMELARRTGITEMDRLMVQPEWPLLRSAVMSCTMICLETPNSADSAAPDTAFCSVVSRFAIAFLLSSAFMGSPHYTACRFFRDRSKMGEEWVSAPLDI